MTALLRTAALALLAAALLGGCLRVQPYQRETLAHPGMRAAPWPALQRSSQHIDEVREGSRGATGHAGGGCGCN